MSAEVAPPSGVRGTVDSLEGDPYSRPLPCVVVIPGTEEELHGIAIKYLERAKGWYSRGGAIVHVGTTDDGSPVILPVSAARFAVRLSGLVRWQKRTKKGDVTEAPCPRDIAASAYTAGDWPTLPALVGVQDVPIMRPDGTLWQEPGFDSVTGVVYMPRCEIPKIPERPTKAEAMEALARCDEVLCDFNYERQEMRFMVHSSICALLARHAINGAIPAHLYTAAQPGTGKGLQCEIIAQIALGHEPIPFHFPMAIGDDKRESDREEEQEKRLAQAAISGTRMVYIDNLKNGSYFGGPIFDRVVAAPDKVALRVLGENHTMPILPWRGVFVVNGNNIHVPNDSRRRCLESRVMSTCSNPSQRPLSSFRFPLKAGYCLKNRGRFVADYFTFLLHHAQEGFKRTHDRPDIANFEEFQRVVCDAIVRAGGLDPSLCILTVEEMLSGEDQLVGYAMRILEKLGSHAAGTAKEGVTASQIAEYLWSSEWLDALKDQRPITGELPFLAEARETFSTTWKLHPAKRPGPKALGKHLGDLCGRVLDGAQVWPSDDPSGMQNAEWKIAMHIDRKNSPRYTIVSPRPQ